MREKILTLLSVLTISVVLAGLLTQGIVIVLESNRLTQIKIDRLQQQIEELSQRPVTCDYR